MAMQEAQILHFENNHISEIKYIETPHYQLTKAFMDNPERYLRELEN
jgi:predicted ATPase